MKPQHFAGALLVAAFFACPLYLLSRSSGAPPASSGGGFPGEGSCTSSGCHDDGQANQGAGTFSLAINGEPADQFRYTPGETATVSVRLNDPAAVRIGFQLTARAGDGCDPGGTLMPGEQQVSVSSGECNANSVQWATHTFPKAGNDAAFSVEWTAPMSDVGAVTLAAAGNGANGVGRVGDNIYQMQAVIQPADDSGGPAPSISSGGVVLGTLRPAVTTGAPNAIATVFGTEFAPAGTAASTTQLDDAGKVPAVLAETCVEVGGRRAPLFFVGPGQINFQIPDQAGMGPEAVTVIRGCGTADERRSADESFNMAAAQPAFFLLNPNASLAVAALHGGGPSFVGPADLFPGVTTPAAPGEVISLYGTGFGATDPPLTAGQIPVRAYPDAPLTRLPASTDVRVAFGDIEVAPTDISYIGGAPCCAGLYQLTVKVPDSAPNGELPVTLTINGVASPEGPFVAVQSATPSDGYAPLELWAVADGSIILGGGVLTLTECLPVNGFQYPPVTGSVYTVHTSRWQRREDENSPWTDIADTERMGQLCPYTATQSGQYRGVADATIDGERAMYSSVNFFTKIVYTPLPLWTVADGTITLGGVLTSPACVPIVDLPFGEATYTVHTSKWQRREDEDSPWTDIADTEQMGQLCPYTATQPGQYRGVADATINGERGMYSSANFFTKE